ncbi:MAG: NADP-dependent malic enzyme [Gammaproteobacteria bacterium]|nr:NADP-dependent malic enzyme [Gammaproteobacteria bacterium]
MNEDSRDSLLVKAAAPAADALRLHPFYRGKVQMMPKCRVAGLEDFSVWYTPGVAAPCRAIAEAADLVYEHTNKGNTIAIVSDGSRVLGLGDIGPEAGLPVMEGKALLFKFLGGVDAVPLCLRARDADDIVHAVKLLEPSFGGINLEDIAAPKCFRVLDALRSEIGIPVWHDDQQGTATVLVAGLANALKVVGKRLASVRIVLVGTGAANVAVYRLLGALGVDPGAIVACDSRGVLHAGRSDLERARAENPQKWRICRESNADGVRGGIGEAMRGADVVVAFSAPEPGIIRPAWVEDMAPRAVVFACANPQPEIWPWDAKDAGAAIVATGRGDFPNQLNNSLCFPGIFRGVLDVRARGITDAMALAAARALAAYAEARGIREDDILPRMDEWEVHARVAVATGLAAQTCGMARLRLSERELGEAARSVMENARAATAVLMREGLIAPPPG